MLDLYSYLFIFVIASIFHSLIPLFIKQLSKIILKFSTCFADLINRKGYFTLQLWSERLIPKPQSLNFIIYLSMTIRSLILLVKHSLFLNRKRFFSQFQSIYLSIYLMVYNLVSLRRNTKMKFIRNYLIRIEMRIDIIPLYR